MTWCYKSNILGDTMSLPFSCPSKHVKIICTCIPVPRRLFLNIFFITIYESSSCLKCCICWVLPITLLFLVCLVFHRQCEIPHPNPGKRWVTSIQPLKSRILICSTQIKAKPKKIILAGKTAMTFFLRATLKWVMQNDWICKCLNTMQAANQY